MKYQMGPYQLDFLGSGHGFPKKLSINLHTKFKFQNMIFEQRVLFQMARGWRYRDRKSGMYSFDPQLSKLKPISEILTVILSG